MPIFDVVVTHFNGVAIPPTQHILGGPSDTFRVELQLTIEPGDVVTAATIAMSFDADSLTLIGPSPGPATFHQTCDSSGTPCSLPPGPGLLLPTGGATFDDQTDGLVGAMGVINVDRVPFPVGTHSLGVVDFHFDRGPAVVRGFDRFPGVTGAFFDDGSEFLPVPFEIGPGVRPVPEPGTILLVALGMIGLSRCRRKKARAA